MALTSQRRIAVAKEFVRIGFGDAIDDLAPFYSHEFLTQVLTTTEVQAVLPEVQQYNAFNGEKVAAAIERFRGKVSGWKFGCAGSPLLIAVLPYATHQIEEMPPAGKSGTRISEESHEALIHEMQKMFIEDLDADKFEKNDDSNHVFGAWWD
jgi:hypothetical protein